MYLIYIDESGKPNLQDSEDFVLGALIINENQWYSIDNQVRALKSHFFPNISELDIEFHASDIANRKGHFQNLTDTELFNLFDSCYTLISNIECCLLASMIIKDNIYSGIKNMGRRYINNWIERWGHKLLFERICLYLDKINKENIFAGNPIDYGILLIDSVNPVYDKLLRQKIIKLLKNGTEFLNNKYLIEDPLFISSQYRNLTQLVDLIAFIVRRKYRQNQSNSIYNQNYIRYFNKIESRFDTDENGVLIGSGIKLFP